MKISENMFVKRGYIEGPQYPLETMGGAAKIDMNVFGIDRVDLDGSVISDADSSMEVMLEKDSARISAVVMDNDRIPNLDIFVNSRGDVKVHNPGKNRGGIVEFPGLLTEKDARALKQALLDVEGEGMHINGFIGGKDPDYEETGGQWHLYLSDGDPRYSWKY